MVRNTPSATSDWSDIESLQRKLVQTVEAMALMSASVGAAKHVIEYDGDRRKTALARAMAVSLAAGDSVSKADSEARASADYAKAMAAIGKQHQAALTEVEKYQCLKLQWETARSLLSMQKEAVKHL